MNKKNQNEFVANFDIDENRINSANSNRSKRKKKFFPIITLIAIILLVGCVAGAAYYLNEKLTPAQKLENGYKELFAPSKGSPENLIGTSEIVKKINSDKSTCNMSLSIDNINLLIDDADYLKDLAGAGISISRAMDVKSKEMESRYDLTYCDTTVLSSDVYTKNNNISVAVPSLFDKVISLNLSDIEESKDSSYILKDIPEEFFEEFDLENLDLWCNYKNNGFDMKVLENAIEEISPGDWKVICDGITITENKDDNIIRLAISKKSMRLFLTDIMMYSIDNKDVEEYLKDFSDNNGINYNKTTIKNQMTEYIKLFTNIFKDGLVIDTTFNSKNQIVKIDFDNTYKLLGVNVDMSYHVKYTGKKNPKDVCVGEAKLGALGYNLTANIKKTSKSDKNSYSYETEHLLTFEHNNNTDISSITCKKSFDPKSGEYTSECTLSSDYLTKFLKENGYDDTSDITIIENGNYSGIATGKKFIYDLDKLSFKLPIMGTIDFSGSYEIDTNALDIAKPKGTELNILDATEEDFDKLHEEILKNSRKFSSAYNELFEYNN